ncbi:class I SAM-dependent methyltransferase [Candidatus Methylopumilus planktonicus]|jgi:ubiquinone/menaquinone biosynthesis C-methylase UbiE|uniref:class I SAM-dependent methyltransferase n=1 Tax=Candidatus Methylopumilus planktonicus TaxID=1581557 RepID=UPI003BEEBEAC
MKVLQDKSQISKARKELDRKGASHVDAPDSRLKSIMRKLGLVRGLTMGDILKSWDVHATLNFIEKHAEKSEPILDIGCYCSEIIASLHKVGYSNLTGADLNPNLKQMPYQGFIKYEVTNFLHTKFKNASFKVITAISVIEHDFNAKALLYETSRLLLPGGYFIASFDYWPEKIDTTGTRFFGMDWKIFSKKDVEEFVSLAVTYNLFPVGELNYTSKAAPIHCASKKYTFGWLVLEKK